MTNKKNVKATEAELNETQELTRTLLMLATSTSAPVGLTSLIMATSVAAVAANIPLEDFTSMFNKTVEEVYGAAVDVGALY